MDDFIFTNPSYLCNPGTMERGANRVLFKTHGHNSFRTTRVYAKIINADLDKAMEVFDD